jgi:general secretion pathway protein D
MRVSEMKMRSVVTRGIALLQVALLAGGATFAQAPPPPAPAPAQAAPAPAQAVPTPAQAPPVQPVPVPPIPAQAAPADANPAPATPAQDNPAQAVTPQATPAEVPVPIGNLSLQNASLVEVINQLARRLKINYILDPAVKGSVVLNTYGSTANMDARGLLDLILRINGAAMIKEGEVYRILPLKDAPKMPLRPQVNAHDIPEDDQIMLNLVFLKYVTVDELTKVLGEFVGENATMYSYAPSNLLFILDSRRNMRRTMELIQLFDSDSFANQRVRLFDVKNTKPSDLVKDLDAVLKAASLDGKSATVRFLPVDRINTLIAVAPNPGVFDTVEAWLKRLDVPVKINIGGGNENHVYRLRYGRAECVAVALNQLFGYGAGYGGGYEGGYGGGYPGGGGYGGAYGGQSSSYGYPNTYAASGAAAGMNGSTYGNGNNFNNNFGGMGACPGSTSGGYGRGGYGGGGYPVYGGYAAQVPANAAGTAPVSSIVGPATPAAPTSGQTTDAKPAVRVVANPLDNALIIQATPEQYQEVLRILKDLDVPPRQILLEAKIYSVSLSGSFSGGVSTQFQRVSGADRGLLGSVTSAASGVAVAALQVGTLVGQSKELLAFLNLSENQGRTTILSEPSLIATDSIPATLNVGTQVPVQTSTSTTVAGSSTVTSSISGQNTGVTLQVNARVNPSGVVTLVINQEVSAPGAGAGTLTPSFDQQVVQTQVTVQDGDTIAIGGLISDTSTNGTSGIPYLSRLPVVGLFFGTKTTSHSRSELIIFMTPHVILDESDLIEASNELRDRVKKLQRYVKLL